MDEKDRVSVGLFIRNARLSKGMTQEELSDSLNMDQRTLSLIEDGFASPTQKR